MQRLELGTGFDAEFVDEEIASSSKGGERFGLAPRAIQRQQVQRAYVLAVRVLVSQRLGLGAARAVLAQSESSVESYRPRTDPHLAEGSEATIERPNVELCCARIAAPQLQRLVEQSDGAGRIVVEKFLSRLDELLELDGVNSDARRFEQVSRGLRSELDRLPQRLAETRDPDLDHVSSTLRRVVAPHRIDEACRFGRSRRGGGRA